MLLGNSVRKIFLPAAPASSAATSSIACSPTDTKSRSTTTCPMAGKNSSNAISRIPGCVSSSPAFTSRWTRSISDNQATLDRMEQLLAPLGNKWERVTLRTAEMTKHATDFSRSRSRMPTNSATSATKSEPTAGESPKSCGWSRALARRRCCSRASAFPAARSRATCRRCAGSATSTTSTHRCWTACGRRTSSRTRS